MLTTCVYCMKTVEVLNDKIVAHRAEIEGKRKLCPATNKPLEIIRAKSAAESEMPREARKHELKG